MRLVGRAELHVAPVAAGHDQVVHPGALADRQQPGVADPAVGGVGGVVVGGLDHRLEHGAVGGARQVVAELAQPPHQQHRLHDAGGHVAAVRGKAVQPPVGVDHRPATRAPARARSRAPPGSAGRGERRRLGHPDRAAVARAGDRPHRRSSRRRRRARAWSSGRSAGRASSSCRRRGAGSSRPGRGRRAGAAACGSVPSRSAARRPARGASDAGTRPSPRCRGCPTCRRGGSA